MGVATPPRPFREGFSLGQSGFPSWRSFLPFLCIEFLLLMKKSKTSIKATGPARTPGVLSRRLSLSGTSARVDACLRPTSSVARSSSFAQHTTACRRLGCVRRPFADPEGVPRVAPELLIYELVYSLRVSRPENTSDYDMKAIDDATEG